MFSRVFPVSSCSCSVVLFVIVSSVRVVVVLLCVLQVWFCSINDTRWSSRSEHTESVCVCSSLYDFIRWIKILLRRLPLSWPVNPWQRVINIQSVRQQRGWWDQIAPARPNALYEVIYWSSSFIALLLLQSAALHSHYSKNTSISLSSRTMLMFLHMRRRRWNYSNVTGSDERQV